MKKLFLIILFSFLFGQDDLLDVLNEGEGQFEYVESAFKSTRVANAQSLEIPKPKILQFMIQHRFGSIENGFYDLFGTEKKINWHPVKLFQIYQLNLVGWPLLCRFS